MDTAANKWRDAGHGRGIVPQDETDQGDDDEQNHPDGDVSDSESEAVSDTYSATSDLQENEDTHYVGLDQVSKQNWLERKTKGITPGGIRKELLRKTVR